MDKFNPGHLKASIAFNMRAIIACIAVVSTTVLSPTSNYAVLEKETTPGVFQNVASNLNSNKHNAECISEHNKDFLKGTINKRRGFSKSCPYFSY